MTAAQTKHTDQEIICSPLTGTEHVHLLQTYDRDELLKLYQKHVGLDVSAHLPEGVSVKRYRCEDSGLEFFYPFYVAGNEAFYTLLSLQEWYYHPARWEHQQALQKLHEGQKLLEVGSGSGAFLQMVAKVGIHAEGLELNPDAIEKARSLGCVVHDESIQAFASAHASAYDVVCTFQVLEHIAQPAEFISAMIQCLKPGGTLIIGVPNNEGFLKNNRHSSVSLNLPPHHMGWWTSDSLGYLAKLFPLTLKQIEYEPLDESGAHIYVWNQMLDRSKGRTWYPRLMWKLNRHLPQVKKALHDQVVAGHTVLATFTKNPLS